jgi:SAM-dependent methyltransferase
MNSSDQDTRLWDQFWSAGRASCCSDQDGTENAELVRQQWVELFAASRDGDRILDLCTGNGAVLDVARECAREAGKILELCGVDSAAIVPVSGESADTKATPLFIRASVTALPFVDASFNAVTSQFGIEYAPLETAVAEAMRVLREGGRARFVAHAKDGTTALNAVAELDDIAELEDDIGIFPATTEALTLVCDVERASSPVSPAEIQKARQAHDNFHQRLARMAEDISRRAARAVYRDTGSILQHTFRNRQAFPLGTLLDKVRETELSVQLHRDRLRALVGAAFDEDACRHLVAACKRHGAKKQTLDSIRSSDGATPLAWVVTIDR